LANLSGCKPCLPTQSNAGPDQLNLSGTSVILTANSPASDEQGTWALVKGNGGVLSSTNSPNTVFTKGTDTSYTAVWAIFGPCGASIDSVHLNFPAPIVPSCGFMINYGGENYSTVKIGQQCWMAKNLNVGIVLDSNAQSNNNATIEKYCHRNDTANCGIFGGLYQWGEAVQYSNGANNTTSPSPTFSGNVQGICPQGWHIPSDAEWCTLIKGLDPSFGCAAIGWSGTNGAGLLKSVSSLWAAPNTGATNSSGFSALPAGYLANRQFNSIGIYAGFWSITEQLSSTVFVPTITSQFRYMNRGPVAKNYGMSVRCLKD
ncbi:MAG: hypothetical protein EBR91_11845, partial [Flavobacteriia bacterium]|nr:hypothetical protein [Flavobacteriia bacterium]